MKDICGAKGDSQEVRTPIEDPNTLQSRAIARFVDLISEGEIEGLVNGEESIFFNNIPIRNASSEYNFSGLNIEFKPGAPDGVSLKDYPTSESELSVDIHVTKDGGAISRNISSPDIDDLRLTFTIPSLFKVKSKNGDILKTSVEWVIDVRQVGGDWVRAKTVKKYGKCISSYQTDVRISNLTRVYGAGPWEVRVLRVTEDSDTNSLQNDLYWTGYTQIINRVLIYPDTAIIGITLNSQQFGSRVPQRSYEIRGIRCQIPSNYNPETRSYSGIWDGTFQRAYTNNPAWVCYDLANNNRYGIGLPAEYIDKWALYTIAQYCDQFVDDGYGDTEPRFTFNGVLQTRTDAIHLLNMIASSFRGMPFWGGGLLSFSQDSPKDSVKLVTAANVVEGSFVYSYSADENRYTVCNVSWNDPDNYYKLQIEAVDDKDGLERYGYKPADVTAVGCTSRGQAYRFGRWFLYTSLYQTETITYRASWDQADVLPGQVITVMDNHEAATRHGGRIDAVGASSVTLDAGIELEVGETYSITCIAKDGTLLERDITNASDGAIHTLMNVDSAWPVGNEPQLNGMWIISASNVEPVLYRVVSNVETEPNIYEITAVVYDPNKFAIVEDGKVFAPAPITKVPDANSPLDPPTNIQVEEYTYEDTGGTSERADRKTGVLLSWTHTRDTRFQTYEVQYKLSTGSFADNELIKTTDNQFDFKPLEAGVYTFRVRARGLARESLWLTISEYTINAMPDAPPDITGLVVINGDDDTTFNGKDCEISWDALNLATDTTSLIHYDSTSPTHAAPFDSELTKLKDYQIEIMTVGDVHLRYEFVIENSFKYIFAMNQLDSGTPLRDLKFKVWARDVFDQLSNNPTTLVVTNPAPDMSGLSPTLTPLFTGIKTDWSAVTPSDNDMAKFRVYLDKNNPPTTKVAEVGRNTNEWYEHNLDAEDTYRAQVEPYDEFGVGTKSNVVSTVPLALQSDQVTGELVNRLVITDSIDTTAADIAVIYDNVTDVDGITYDSTSWVKFKFPIEQLLDRVSVWADKSLNVYFSVSTDDNNWTYFKAEGDHTLDADGRLLEATGVADAETNYWTADAGNGNINLALFPNGLVFAYARMHIMTDNVEVYEIIFTDQVIAEQIIARDLAAISADLGTIRAGTLQSSNWAADAGIFIDLDAEDIKVGGWTDPKLHWDSTKIELALSDNGKISVGTDGAIEVGERGKMTVGDGGFLRIGNNIQLDSLDNSGARGTMLISQDTTIAADGRLNLSGVDYMQMSEASLDFYYWDTVNSMHQPYKSLVRIERGVANNNTLVYIPGIFKEAPQIMISPNVGPSYNKDYANQSQTHNYQVKDLTQYQTYRWRFTPVAALELSDGVGGTILNSTKTSTGDMWSNTTNLSPNTRKLSVVINSSGYRNQTRGAWTGGKDGSYVYYCDQYNVYYNIVLYYMVNGIWKTITKAHRPGSSGSNYYNLTISTATQGNDITKFAVLFDYLNYYAARKKTSTGSCLNKIYNTLTIDRYTTNLTGASVITTGSLNWLAIGS